MEIMKIFPLLKAYLIPSFSSLTTLAYIRIIYHFQMKIILEPSTMLAKGYHFIRCSINYNLIYKVIS